MLTVDIISQAAYKFDRKRVRQALESILLGEGLSGSEVEISLAVVGERKMRELHKKYLGSEEVTDVLSFPLEEAAYPDGILRLGDIVICYPEAINQAREGNRMVDEEMEFLAGHGLNHLLGKHHDEQ